LGICFFLSVIVATVHSVIRISSRLYRIDGERFRPLKQIQEWLGHSDISTKQIFIAIWLTSPK